MSIIFDWQNLEITDTRSGGRLFNGEKISVCYTLLSDDITKGKKPASTPYTDRTDVFTLSDGALVSDKTESRLDITPYGEGLILELYSARTDISEYGINLPFNFMGKLDGGGWEKQLLFNSVYSSSDKKITYAYLTRPNGCNIAVAILDGADGWKMDYSPFSWGHYFINLKLLASYDKAYVTSKRPKRLRFAILPVTDFESCLSAMSELYSLPFLDYSVSGGALGEKITLIPFGAPDALIERKNGEERVLSFSNEYTVSYEGEAELIPVKNGKRGAGVTVYGYESLVSLYKKSMDTVNPDIIKKYTDANLCEHQCWASAMLRFLMKYGASLTEKERSSYEKKLLSLLDIITEQDESRATPRTTILNKPHGRFPAYNVFSSSRVQELFFGITILLDAYKYFGNEKYYTYAIGATDTLISHYQGENGALCVDWGDGSLEDYTTVCCAMIPLADMANFTKDKDAVRSERYRMAADKMASYVFGRGMSFPTEGGKSALAEAEMEEGSISCTALTLLYYCKNVRRDEKYIKKAKEILDIHDTWVIKTPVCQMHGSTLRWWETQWEGDADGPAICAGHAWSIWRAEADYLYYELSGDTRYLEKSRNGFLTNLSKIDTQGRSYAIYNPDEINGGGFHECSDGVAFRIAKKFPDTEDCGMSRYVWIRINDTFLKQF